MSLLINGMDMPKNCAECPILQTGSLEHYCPLAKESMWSIDAESVRHNNCPLSEIPTPHGRLIDADRLIVALKNSVYANAFFHTPALTVSQIEQLIENQPTVIEKEKE